MLVYDQISDYAPLLKDFNEGNPVTIRFAYPSRKTLKSVNSLVAQILSSRDRIFLLESLVTIMRECIFNATKANAKRLFFETEKYDITDPQRYEKLMNDFKARVLMQFESLSDPLQMSNYRADFTIIATTDAIRIDITNNVPLLPEERERIAQRITAAAKFKDFTEVYDELYDDTEGAGLGIILTQLILRNMGITKNGFVITSSENATLARLTIPNVLRPIDISTKLRNQIITQVNGLPTFPQTTLELIEMCGHPEIPISKIADRIRTDAALTADLLKLANSAGFAARGRAENINDAIVRIGIKNLKFMLIAASSRTILEQRFKKFESIWQHCFQTAFYARNIARELKLSSIEDQVFICGLLHDMGKIVLLTVDLTMTNLIADIVEQHRIRTTTVIEEISIGISHSSIGKLLADKWNFSDFLIQGIEFHHSPNLASAQHAPIVFITYLANLFCGIEKRKYEYSFADSIVLEKLGITGEEQLQAIHEKTKALYEAEQK